MILSSDLIPAPQPNHRHPLKGQENYEFSCLAIYINLSIEQESMTII